MNDSLIKPAVLVVLFYINTKLMVNLSLQHEVLLYHYLFHDSDYFVFSKSILWDEFIILNFFRR